MTAPDGNGPVISDIKASRPTTKSTRLHHGAIVDLFEDEIDLGADGTVRREYLKHPGAVAIIALNDQDQVLLQRQYRHSVRHELWEPPAGLLDEPGESPLAAAQRELLEEADLTAERWDLLVDYMASPGCLDEIVRIFVARDLRQVPESERFHRVAEERDMPAQWVSLEDAERAIFQGQIHSPSALVGLLAAMAAKKSKWSTLRPVSTLWLRATK